MVRHISDRLNEEVFRSRKLLRILESKAASDAFPDELFARWSHNCRKLAQAGYGNRVVESYLTHSIQLAGKIGADAAIDVADTVSGIAIKAGRRAAEQLPVAALIVAEQVPDERVFKSWLGLMERFAALAPESLSALLDKTEYLFSHLNVARLESWVLAGLRSSVGDPGRRLNYFSFKDPEAERWLQRESGEVIFADMARHLKTYLTALWRIQVPMREPPISASEQARRRSSFDRGIIRVPASFPGYRGPQAEEIYRACVAHIGAHMIYSGKRYPVKKLKPIQVALISLIEDARVEYMASREFPGLQRLWLPFHIAQSSGVTTAPSLLARLARSLIDPAFRDVNPWISKAREEFFDRVEEFESPELCREFGGRIGNDLGQMRVQFNPRTYVVEPPYRDDNLGLWDFDDEQKEESLEAEQLLDSVRIDRQYDEKEHEQQKIEEKEDSSKAQDSQTAVKPIEAEGIPVARYPEYDYVTGRERVEWVTVYDYMPRPGPARRIEEALEKKPEVVRRITALINSAMVSRAQRVKRQMDGEFLDLDACIEASISRRIGETPDPHIYGNWERRNRDLSVLVLLDVSESTRDRVSGSDETVLQLEIQATALLAEAMSSLGDPFAIAAFCSNCREELRYFRIKDFTAPYDGIARSYLSGLESGYSTRMGAAMRHAGEILAAQDTYRKLLLVVTDGEPSDIDVTDATYLVEDARRVVNTLGQRGIDSFGVGLESGCENYMNRIFGRRNVAQIDRVEKLPERLPLLYLRLTA